MLSTSVTLPLHSSPVWGGVTGTLPPAGSQGGAGGSEDAALGGDGPGEGGVPRIVYLKGNPPLSASGLCPSASDLCF